MSRPIKVLIVEDNEDDALLVVHALQRGGFDVTWERVETRAAMSDAIDRGPWDLIISDYRMPQFDAKGALALYRERQIETPFLLVSGTIGEEQATESLRSGAHDFLLKDRLSRLCPAVERELREADNRRARKRAEAEKFESLAALARSEQRLMRMIEFAPDAMVISNHIGAITLVNAQTEKLFGYSREELMQMPVETLFPGRFRLSYSTQRGRYLSDSHPHTSRSGRELFGRKKDGTEFPIEVVHSPLELEEERLVSSAIRDISERRQTEQMLLQSQKLEAIGRLAGGVAHDFNNVLGVIIGYGEIAQKMLGAEHPAYSRVGHMLTAAQRAAGLTRQLLAFSRKQVLQPEVIDLNRIVVGTHSLLVRLIGEDITIDVRQADGLGAIRADPGQIEQIIMNLAVNARDAMPRGGCFMIETSNIELDDEYASAHPPLQPGSFVMLAVSDTGVGMDAATQARIFEPFFTTKPAGEGTGLGLATVHGIVQQSGGHIWLYSEVGRGTTFKIYFPRIEERASDTPPPASVGETPGGNETVLVVEDTETLQEVTKESLEALGYTVLVAIDGEHALRVAREYPHSIDLLLTDVVMPKLGGGELARQLSALYPKLRVLYMSGYTDGAISHQGVLREGIQFLGKPFTGAKLARAVRDVLDRPPSTA